MILSHAQADVLIGSWYQNTTDDLVIVDKVQINQMK